MSNYTVEELEKMIAVATEQRRRGYRLGLRHLTLSINADLRYLKAELLKLQEVKTVEKYTRELIAGDVVKAIDGSIVEIVAVHSIKEDPRLFAISYFNRTTQTDEFDYQHGAVKCEMVGA